MTLTTHAAAGILLSGITDQPVVAFLFGVGSHYILDVLPHGDEFLYWRHVKNRRDVFALLTASCDLFALTILLLLFLSRSTGLAPPMMLGIFGAILPDLLVTLHTKNRKKFREHYEGRGGKIQKIYHLFLQKHYILHGNFHDLIRTPVRFRTGILYQMVALGLFLKFYLS